MSKELSIPEFVDALLRRIAAEPGCGEAKFDPRARAITFRHPGGVATLAPGSAYAEYKADNSRLGQIITACISAALAPSRPAQAPAKAAPAFNPNITLSGVELTSMGPSASDVRVRTQSAAPQPVAAKPASVTPPSRPFDPTATLDGFKLTPMFADNKPAGAAKPQPASVSEPPGAAQLAAEHEADVRKKKWADMAGTLALSMQMDAEDLRGSFRQNWQIELDYSTQGVRNLDAWLCQTYKARTVADEGLIARLGAFLGQCIMRNLEGSRWIVDEGDTRLQLGGGGGSIVPAKVVQNLWESGPDRKRPTLAQFYETIVLGKTDAPGWDAPPPPKAGAVTAAAAAPRAPAAPSPDRPLWVDAYPAESQAADTLAAIAANLAELRKDPIALTRLIAASPAWMQTDDPLRELSRQQVPLLAGGELVWAALVRADKPLLKSGEDDHSMVVVYSRDHHFDSRPQELQQIAANLLRAREMPGTTPEVREAASFVSDEQGRNMDKPVPKAVTDKDVRLTTCMGYRRHLPHGVLVGATFPLLISAQTQAVMIVPAKAWPAELCAAWEPDERTYERVRKLPVGLRVSCSPSSISAQPVGDGKYVWPMRPTVESLYPELTVFEYGLFVEERGKWTLEGDPQDGKAFAASHRCPGGILKKGQPAHGGVTQAAPSAARARQAFWYYLAKDAEGKIYRGDCTVEELCPPPPPPAPTAAEIEAQKKAGGLWGSLKNAIGAGEAPEPGVRHDGLYRGKADASDTWWLRLCEDGTALAHIAAERPKDLEKTFHPGNRQLARGSYKVMGERIYIDIVTSDAKIVLTGSAHKPQLQLDLSNARQKNKVKFSFVGWG